MDVGNSQQSATPNISNDLVSKIHLKISKYSFSDSNVYNLESLHKLDLAVRQFVLLTQSRI
jgi:hypothetical protein